MRHIIYRLLFALTIFFSGSFARAADWPSEIPSGKLPANAGHLQGLAVDAANKVLYRSFTNALVKTDLEGKILGSVIGLTGHLGDIAFYNGKIYGSLEYKAKKSFYIAIFDANLIDKIGMNAETDDVMKTVYLKEVVKDFTTDLTPENKTPVDFSDKADSPDHRYGCSGIDGVAFGPAFDPAAVESAGVKKTMLTVGYGVYSNVRRKDNDHQVLLQYDVTKWDDYARPLKQSAPHESGPENVDGKYFVYTGNTSFGVQNLEYDETTNYWFLAVYKGLKPKFPNYKLFLIDGDVVPTVAVISGQPKVNGKEEEGQLLPLAALGRYHKETGIFGMDSDGAYGMAKLDDGRFYLAPNGSNSAVLRKWTGKCPIPFEGTGQAIQLLQ
ncbi:hypothetical protein [Phyllobacterium zundukense]|jgi:hypothetical protein|uniref:Uncharacterized protein n=1 Tax=Phyllobacterium zundukense TaxID=1867719 RepID=A0ACD4D3F9_9HYPH|nr:hypothetical protein [Phyllobacterium zundukense]UXN60457.1 hypothetical protein N8E88_28860 [Phyllobacterium zundukense]